MLPTDAHCKHESMINAIQNAGITVAKELNCDVFSIPFSHEEAEHFLFALRKEGLNISHKLRRKSSKEARQNRQPTRHSSKPQEEITPEKPKQWTHTQAMHANDCEGY